MLTELLLLDIETVPQAETFDDLDPRWRLLFSDKISKTVPEDMVLSESYRKKAGILAEFGKIICISTAFFYQENDGGYALKMKSICNDDEVQLLRDFIVLCDKMHAHKPAFQFAGHNIKEFDIPYICRRLMINHLTIPVYMQYHDKKPWEVKMFDTMNWWKFGDNKNYVSLNLLASVLGIPTSKTDIDGSMVQDVYYRDKDLPRITAYCQRDVVVTANIILRFKNLPPLGEQQVTLV